MFTHHRVSAVHGIDSPPFQHPCNPLEKDLHWICRNYFGFVNDKTNECMNPENGTVFVCDEEIAICRCSSSCTIHVGRKPDPDGCFIDQAVHFPSILVNAVPYTGKCIGSLSPVDMLPALLSVVPSNTHVLVVADRRFSLFLAVAAIENLGHEYLGAVKQVFAGHTLCNGNQTAKTYPGNLATECLDVQVCVTLL